MENPEFEKLIGCIMLVDPGKEPELREALSTFMQQVKAAVRGAQNKVPIFLVFEGKQGTGKSTLARKIAGDHSFCHLSDMTKKDALLAFTENHVIEFEYMWMTDKDFESIKRIVSSTSMSIRKPFQKESEVYPVKGSLICTINDAGDLESGRRMRLFKLKGVDELQLQNVDVSKVYQSI